VPEKFLNSISVHQRRAAVKNLPAVPFPFFVYFAYFVVKNLPALRLSSATTFRNARFQPLGHPYCGGLGKPIPRIPEKGSVITIYSF